VGSANLGTLFKDCWY